MGMFLEIDPDISMEVDYGATNRRLINIYDFHRMLGDSTSKAAIFVYTELTAAFKQLSFHPSTTCVKWSMGFIWEIYMSLLSKHKL